MNLNDFKLKMIREGIKIQKEFLNMNHDEQLCTVLLHGEKWYGCYCDNSLKITSVVV